MSRNVEIKCDGCGADLTTTGNCTAYRLRLAVEAIPSAGRTVTLMGVVPPLTSDKDFCSLRCLRDWADG